MLIAPHAQSILLFSPCVFCSVTGTFLYVLNGEDPETAIGLVACMINNTGLAFRVAGPAGSCAFMDDFSYILSSFLMLVGRLEFLAVICVFSSCLLEARFVNCLSKFLKL